MSLKSYRRAAFPCLAGRARAVGVAEAIAVVGEAAPELFQPYYDHTLPALKHLIASCSGDKQRRLRGKAFECGSESTKG